MLKVFLDFDERGAVITIVHDLRKFPEDGLEILMEMQGRQVVKLHLHSFPSSCDPTYQSRQFRPADDPRCTGAQEVHRERVRSGEPGVASDRGSQWCRGAGAGFGRGKPAGHGCGEVGADAQRR